MKNRNVLTFRVLAAVLAVYGSFSLWQMLKYESIWFLVWTLPCFFGAVGLLMSRSWAQYIYYAIAFFAVVGWAAFVYLMWPSLTEQVAQWLLFLGGAKALFCAISSVVLFRSFRSHATQGASSSG